MNKKAEKYLLNLVNSNYEDIAESFNETRKKPMKPMVLEIVESLNIKTEDKVLDLGCGNGRFLDVLGNDKNYLGVDNSKNLIKFAREKYGDKFQVLDVLKLDSLVENNFNFVFSWAVFHHIPGNNLRLDFLNQVYDKMKDNSTLVISVWKLRQKKNFFCLALKSFLNNFLYFRFLDWGDLVFNWGKKKNGIRPRYYHAFFKKEFKNIFKKSKFKIENFLEDEFNYYIILKK
ncbi:MAG: class I SAM-dependent methyltransferase [Patescibacteria group bacterium]|nr:class I SAM-dependent methyltransferase [Patescibacteria group bacterium]